MRQLFVIGTLVGLSQSAGLYQPVKTPTVECPVGFILTGKKCEQKVISPARISCPLGVLEGNKCVTNTETIKTCPIGATPENNECKIYQYDTPHPECPPGFILENNSCIQKIPLQIQEICEIGKPDGKGSCVATERVSKVIKKSCPVGFQDEETGCSKTTTYDCSPDEVNFPKPVFLTPAVVKEQPVVTPVAAPAPMPVFAASKKGGHHRMLGGKRSYVPFNLAPIAPVAPAPVKPQITIQPPLVVRTQPVVPIPPSNVAIVKQLCQRQDYAPYVTESFCPQGYAPDGDSCFASATYPMTAQCVNGQSAANCFEPKIAPITRQCSIGALVGDRCVLARTIPQEVVCPAGTEKVGSVCQQYTTPSYACPPGHIMEGASCIGLLSAEPIGVIQKPCVGKECWNHIKH